MKPRDGNPHHLFQVMGIELEYPVVGPGLNTQCLVEPLFRRIAGRPSSEAEHHKAVFSNELAAHVFEIKTREPDQDLLRLERRLVEGLQYVVGVLRDEFDARLLPTGMHPFMKPASGRLWPRAGKAIYETYARLFPIHEHGWMNVQSCHLNLPFGSEEETVLLHNAIACLLPYLPALAASSPIYEGKPGPFIDNRLAFYKGNQKRIPFITGEVIPEYMSTYSQYRREILRRIYDELDHINGAARLKHEWVNSRGVVVRFSRQALEIRTLDSQECVKMDVAMACYIRAALKVLYGRLREGRFELPEHSMLVWDFDAVIAAGRHAQVAAKHLSFLGGSFRATPSAGRLLLDLLEYCEPLTPSSQRHYLKLVETRLRKGNLSEKILQQLRRKSARCTQRQSDVINGIYSELADCLETNTPWRINPA